MDEVFSSRIKPKACFLVIKMANQRKISPSITHATLLYCPPPLNSCCVFRRPRQDVPIIVVTTAIQAYLAGYDVREWHAIAIVSYIFSLFAMQQKAMKLGLAKDVDDVLNNRVAERQQEIGPCFWWVVVLRSLGAVALALILAWAISLFIIFFAPDPPE